MTLQLAELFESVAAAVPERDALVARGSDGRRVLSYGELDRRADAVASLLWDRGVGVGDRVGVHLRNHVEHVEVLLAIAKLRAVPVNANTRYTADELAYVLADASAAVVFTEPDLEPVASAAAASVAAPVDAAPSASPPPVVDASGSGTPTAGFDVATAPVAGNDRRPAVVVVDDRWRSSVDERVQQSAPERGTEPSAEGGTGAWRDGVGTRSADDLWLIYTGGTTGRPKGVVWRHEDLFLAALGGRGVPSRGVPEVRTATDAAARALADEPLRRRAPFCPLIHGGALWIVFQALLSGGTAIISTDLSLDPVAALDLLAEERVELTMVIGDAVAGPIVDALAEDPERWDLGDLRIVASGGAILSPAVSARWTELLPGVRVLDTFGASETGGQGRLLHGGSGRRPVLLSDSDTEVLDEQHRPVAPGEVGRLARSGNIPIGYWGDEERTAATFPVVDGRRWSVPGDMARREADGTITLLGRGATSINTGGEKVFPEEVESVLKAHPLVGDALVVGVPHERFGEQVSAVVALRSGARSADPSLEVELQEHCREALAGYKVPRRFTFVESCQRLPTGKPDYTWARSVAIA